MKRYNKESHLDMIKRNLSTFSFFLFANFQGVNANDFFILRKTLKCKGIKLMVIKNSLASIAFNRLEKENLSDRLLGPMLMLCSNDMVETSRAFVDTINNKDKISIVCAYHNSKIIEKEDILYLSKLPSLDNLRVQIMKLISYSVPFRLSVCLKSIGSSEVSVDK